MNVGTFPRSDLIHSQRVGRFYLNNLDIETKWEWKLKNSFNLKFSFVGRGMGRFKREGEDKTTNEAIVAAIDRSCLRID